MIFFNFGIDGIEFLFYRINVNTFPFFLVLKTFLLFLQNTLKWTLFKIFRIFK